MIVYRRMNQIKIAEARKVGAVEGISHFRAEKKILLRKYIFFIRMTGVKKYWKKIGKNQVVFVAQFMAF